jgi:two-component sensor histidine kinase/CHASE1-domain containing sensor protein
MLRLAQLPRPIAILLLAALYLAVGLTSHQFAVPISEVATIWPASALAFFAVLFLGDGVLPGVALGAFASNLVIAYGRGPVAEPVAVVFLTAAQSAVYALQAWVGATLTRRTIALPSAFDDPRDIMLLFLWAGILSPLVSAVPSPYLLELAGAVGRVDAASIGYWWVGEVTGICIALPILLALFAPPRETWRRRRAVILIPTVLGALAAIFFYQRVLRADQRRVEVQFAERSRSLATRARSVIEVYEEGLRAIERLFGSSTDVTAEEFASFVRPFIERHPGVLAVAYAPALAGRERAAILYAEPAATRARLGGTDLAGQPLIAAALRQSRETRDVAATAGLALPLGNGREGFIMIAPVVSRQEVEPAQLRGYVVAAIVLDEVLAATTQGLESSHLTVGFHDVSAAPLQSDDLPSAGEIVDALFVDQRLAADAVVEAAGRTWRLTIAATPEFAAAFHEWKAWTVLNAGLLFTSLLGAFLLAGSGRSARIEALVVARTAEMEETNAKLRTEIARRRRTEKAVARHAEDLERSNAEKEVLLKEIHHRVKNNLQIISSLLSLQSRQIDEPGAREAFRESQGRVRSMALFHEQIYRSRDLAGIQLGDYIRNVATTLIQTYAVDARSIGLTVASDGAVAGIDLAISCGLIVNELVVNSIKYAFADGAPGHIEIKTEAGPDSGVIVVSDDGVGMPPGFDLSTADSFGLQLVVTLVEQLEGSLSLSPGGGPPGRPGTRFVVRLPRPKPGKTPVPLPLTATPTPLPERG